MVILCVVVAGCLDVVSWVALIVLVWVFILSF